MAYIEGKTPDYDYIICGAGTAGCVIARRLAENPNISVLLIEAGKARGDIPASAVPAAVSRILGTDADWNIESQPCPALDNRRSHLGRGKFVGGSSGCNGMLCIRGVPHDYDDWSVEGWSGSEMFSYMKKAEKFHQKDWFEAAEEGHGSDGPLFTAPHDPAPISSRDMDSFQSKGLPLKPDMFTTGDAAQGCGHAIRSIHNGVRTTSIDYIDKIILTACGNGLRAIGVQVQDKTGTTSRFGANKEVILASGAYGSPAVLLRSGVGPKDELAKLGISTHVDLPGVGKNLMDHLVLLNFYEV